MKTVSNDFKQEITKLGRQYKNKINIYGDGHLATQDNRLILTQDNMMLIVENSVNKVLEDDLLFNINLSRKGKILSTMMKELDFESYEDISVGNVIEYLFGLKIGDIYELSSDGVYKANADYYKLIDDKYILMIQDEDYVIGETIGNNVYNRRDNYEWINFNKFIVYSKEYNEDTKRYSYVCYDYMLKTMIPINNTITIQNTKIKNAIKNIADNFGLITTLDTTEYPNLNKVINSNAFNNIEATYRDVLDMICQAIGTTMIASDDNLILKSLNTSPVCTLDSTYLKDTNVSFGKKYGPINSLVLSRSGQTDNIYRQDTQSIEENGLTEFKINDNLILLYNDREQYIDNIFSKLNGVEYYINDFSSTGVGFIEFLDFYNITIDENTYKCLMLNSDFKVKNGISEEISTEEPEETNTNYKTSGKTDKDVSFIVDKQTASINAKVSKGEVINEINLDSSGASINANKISLAGKTIQLTSDNITIASNKFSVDSNGNVECSNMNITGGTLEIGNKFEVDKHGNVECSSIDITGGTLEIGNKFDVDQYGNVECASIDITGGTLNINNKFDVDQYGNLTATSADISGTINSEDGYIGGWKINSDSLSNSKNGYKVWFESGYLVAQAPGDTPEDARWYDLVINYSDKRVKNTIENLDDKYEDFYNSLKPSSFKFNKQVRPEDYEKIHFGFIAQDILENEKENKLEELAMITQSQRSERYQMDKEEIIALNTWQIQKLKKQVNNQQEIIDNLLERINKLEEDKK